MQNMQTRLALVSSTSHLRLILIYTSYLGAETLSAMLQKSKQFLKINSKISANDGGLKM